MSLRVLVAKGGRILCALMACLAIGTASAAQETINQGTISGRVLDAQGAAVPGALVTVRQTDTGVTIEATTDTNGRFRFPYLRIGPYELRAKLRRVQGTRADARVERRIRVRSSDHARRRRHRCRRDRRRGHSRAGNGRSQIVGTVPQAEVQNLPMNGRNFLDLALLVPGVSPTNTNSTQLFAETSALPGQGLSIASQRNLSNSFIVDGLSANDDAAGLSGIPFGVDAIEQFQVVTGGGQAELGRALGGYVNVVTRSGTNTLHGTLYGFFRDDAFNGKNALTKTTLPMDQQQFGGSLGGPLVRNRTFYFANVERKLLDQTGVVTILPENVPIINARLVAGRLPRTAGRNGYLSESGAQHERARQDRASVERRRSTEHSLRALRRHARATLAASGR